MAYIYKITNNINNKIYIGKTVRTIQERFKEHCKDYQKENLEKRPLYSAMKKYGVENFSIELIEETNSPEERERYWIEYYGSFKNGYNATFGGDGKAYIDYDLVIATYLELQNQQEVAEKLNIHNSTVHYILKNYEIPIKKGNSKQIAQYSLNNEFVCSYSSGIDAAKKIKEQKISLANTIGIAKKIRECAKGKRKTAYGYKWKFI